MLEGSAKFDGRCLSGSFMAIAAIGRDPNPAALPDLCLHYIGIWKSPVSSFADSFFLRVLRCEACRTASVF